MRLYAIAFSAVVFLFSACGKDSISEIYTGTLTITSTGFQTDIPASDTVIHVAPIDLRFELNDGILTVLKTENGSVTEGCSDAFSLSENVFTFTSTACSCNCDCDPNIDCAGHPIMGEYEAELSDNQLSISLFSSFENTSTGYTTQLTKTGVFTKE